MVDEEHTMKSATETGQPVLRRLATPKAVFSVMDDLDSEDRNDAYRRATIQGMIDGNPPYVQKDLDDAGLGTMTNVNFMSLSANLNARAAAAHELLVEVPSLVELRPVTPDPKDQLQGMRCSVLREELSTIIKEWPGFLPMHDVIGRETDAYGLGPLMFKDIWDWRPEAFKRGNLRVAPKAKVVVDDNELFMIRDEYSAGYLFALLDNEEAARIAGWKVEYLKDILTRVFGESQKGTAGDDDLYLRSSWESIQQAYKNNDPEVQAKEFEQVAVRHVLIREVSGERGITHIIIPENKSYEYFLFEKPHRFKSMDNVLWWLPANYGDGYVKSVRGIASWMAKHDDLGNRFLCRTFDAGFLTSGMVLKPKAETDISRLEFVQHGPYTILPAELDAVQSTFMPQVAQLIQLRGVSESIMKNNTGTTRRFDETLDDDAQRKTARQVVDESGKEQRYAKAEVAFRYQQYDRLYTEMFRRITAPELHNSSIELPGQAEAQEFIKRCVARGLKSSDIVGKADKYRISATRAIGLGSPSMKSDAASKILAARAMFDSIGQRNALRDFVADLVGYDNVDKYVPPVSRDLVPSNETSHAVLENNDLQQGQKVLVGSDQLHKVHLDVVLKGVIIPIIDAFGKQQIQKPEAAYATLIVAIPHAEDHLAYVKQDSAQKDYTKGIEDVLRRATAVAKKLKVAVERMRAEQQKQQQKQQQMLQQAQKTLQDRDLEAKIHEINKKYEAKRMEQESLNDMREDKTGRQGDIAEERSSRDSTRRDVVAAADIRRQDAKAEQQE